MTPLKLSLTEQGVADYHPRDIRMGSEERTTVRQSDPTGPRGITVSSSGIDPSPPQQSWQQEAFVVDARIENDRHQTGELLPSQRQIPERLAGSLMLAAQAFDSEIPRQALKDALDSASPDDRHRHRLPRGYCGRAYQSPTSEQRNELRRNIVKALDLAVAPVPTAQFLRWDDPGDKVLALSSSGKSHQEYAPVAQLPAAKPRIEI